MAYDGITTKKIVAELQTVLVGGKINKIYEPTKNEIILGIYSKGNNYALCASISSDSYHLNLTTHQKPNPINALGFCMLLRKHLNGAKINKIYTLDLERVVYIELECYNELNDIIHKKLIIELMGKHSNIILTNENDIIIDSLRHLSKEENSLRDILPARPYEIPTNEKISFNSIKTFDEFYKLLIEKIDISSAVSSTFTGFSKSFIKNLLNYLEIPDKMDTKNLKIIYKSIQDLISNIETTNTSIEKIDKDFSVLPKENPSILQANFFIDDYYNQKENNALFSTYKNNILKVVLSTLSKIKKKLYNINLKIQDCKNMDTYKLYGELITANMYKYKAFEHDTVTVNNYYTNENIQIPVDKNKSPSVNAKNYYKKYNKLKNALNIVNQQKIETISELDYLESIVYEIDSAKTLTDIDEIYTEIVENSLFEKTRQKSNAKTTKQKQKNKKENKEFIPHEFKVENFTLLVGKNNVQNDYLTTKYAKSNDIWFHTKDIHGSHAILITKGETPSMDILVKCAQIAAYYSKARMSSNVPVDYTQIKYVKKPSGSKPGFVIYTHNKTINVTPIQTTGKFM